MIDHVSIGVSNLAASAAFYQRVLAAIGYEKLVERDGTIGFGKRYPDFWLNERRGHKPKGDSGLHICLRTRDMEAVDAFHAAALKAGAMDEGEPGLRPEYNDNYYAAFIRDPEGYRVEVVTFVTDEG